MRVLSDNVISKLEAELKFLESLLRETKTYVSLEKVRGGYSAEVNINLLLLAHEFQRIGDSLTTELEKTN